MHVVVDATSSRSMVDRKYGLEVRRLGQALACLSELCTLLTSSPPSFFNSSGGCRVCRWTAQRMKQSGAYLTTCEAMLFQLMGDAKHPNFKEVQKLIKDLPPDSELLSL